MQVLIDNQGLVTLAVLGVVTVLLLLLLLRRPGRDAALAAELSRTEAELGAGEERRRAAEDERDELRGQLEHQRIACGRLETERDALTGRLGEMERKLQERDEAVHARDRQIATLGNDVSRLTETLRAERETHVKLLEETERNREQVVAQFKAISAEILQTQGRTTAEAQKSELEKIISPFKAEIEGLKTNLKDISDKAEKERQSLGTQIHLMQSKAAELAEEANGLARALRGDRKKQGNWGEIILERVLEAAGLEDGIHFMRQAATTAADGSRIIPDIVLNLPGGRTVVIDSKVTLVAYQDMVQAEDREAEAAAQRRHLQAVRNHVRGLSGKSYGEIGPLDSVMMFLPVDGALSAALSMEPDLVVEAAEKHVHLMTPTTLMPVLKIVEHLWTIDNRNRNVERIVDRAGQLHDKFALVVESIQKIGEHLRKASDCQDEAVKRMASGPGNVLRQVDMLRQLGARARKNLPPELLETDDRDDGEPAVPDDGEAPAALEDGRAAVPLKTTAPVK